MGKVKEISGHIYHASIFIHHHHAARPHHRPRFFQGVKVNGRIQKSDWDASARGPSDLYCLEFLFIWDTTSYVEDEGPQRYTHGDFHQAWVNNIANDGENGGPRTVLSAHVFEPTCTVAHNGWN